MLRTIFLQTILPQVFIPAIFLPLLAIPAVANPLSKICPADLSTKIAAITQRQAFRRARWGIVVATTPKADQPSRTLYQLDGDRTFIPASNAKLLSTAAVLNRLGATYRIDTTVVQDPDNVLRIIGKGDPSLTDADLKELADKIRQQNITKINRLVVDDRWFGEPATNPTWEWGDLQAGYGTSINSLILNENQIGLTLIPQRLGQPLRVRWDEPTADWRIQNRSRTVATTEPEFVEVGRDFNRPIVHINGQLRVGAAPEPVSVSVPDPAAAFAAKFRQALATAGIQVNQTRILTPSSPAIEQAENPKAIATHTSKPLSELLKQANQQSNNLYAEALLRTLGKVDTPTEDASLESGLAAVKAELTQLKVEPDSYSLEDASGLSRHNLVTPTALVETLNGMARSPQATTYRESLAVAGINGTLRNRFKDTVVAGKLYGKTGSISGVATLSGYLMPANYDPLTFSILVNQSEGENRAAIDEIVLILAQLQRCE
jgi:serine-type D-Ala-D-Ala carboxypeptidase/endopeptidase (penicillin-binding protein 4)